MAAKLGVITVHGMGRQSSTFAGQFHRILEQGLAKVGVPFGTVAFCSLYWADLVEKREEELWKRMERSGELDWRPLRRFFVHNFADAVAYRRGPAQAGAIYDDIHAAIRTKLRAFSVEIGDATPVILVAHSLGGAIMSDYIWDRQEKAMAGDGSMERLANLVGIVTFGCNIPLFTLALPLVEPILLPSPELAPALQPIRRHIEWHNYYDPDDVLGWPLADAYDRRADGQPAPRIIDHHIQVGGWLSSWNPKSHSEYWTDRSFTTPVRDHIHRILMALS